MELKRILARDTRTATEQAIRLYGEDVLIVSNHRVGQQTELVLAVDVPQQAPSDAAAFAATSPTAPAVATAPAASAPGFRQQLDGVMSQSASLATTPAGDDRDRVRSQELVALVREELADLKREFRLHQKSAALEQGMQWDEAVMPLVNSLRDSAMPGGLRTLLLDSLQQHDDAHQAHRALREQLLAAAGSTEAGMPARGQHVLAGPAGCGKTTLAARLARWGVQEFGTEQVALISFCDQRAGAWSQVQILGAQAGVEVFRVMDAETLQLLMSDIGHRALVVIDTPGVHMAEQVRQVLAVCPQARVHAVLAADSSQATCQRVLAAPEFSAAALMVSKLDEADAPWALLQFLCNSTTPPARSLLSSSDRLTQPVQTWSVADLVDHAMQVSGLIPTARAEVSNHIPAKPTGLSVRDLNG
jgi:flagellar biosynthesis protein FlhF